MDIDPIEIAQKQRHLYLLTKVRDNRHLSRAEMKEINELEEKMSKDKSQISKGKSQAPQNVVTVADAEIIRSQEQAALLVGKSTRTIRRYEREGMQTFKGQDGKKIYLKSQLLLFAANEGKQPTKTKMKKDEGSAALTQTKAEIAQMELEEKRGRLVNREEFEKKNIRKVLAVKSGIFSMIRNIVAAVPAEHRRAVQKIADKEARALIEEFSR